MARKVKQVKRLKLSRKLPRKLSTETATKTIAKSVPPEIVFRLRAESGNLICERLPYRNFPYELLARITDLVEKEVEKLVARGPDN